MVWEQGAYAEQKGLFCTFNFEVSARSVVFIHFYSGILIKLPFESLIGTRHPAIGTYIHSIVVYSLSTRWVILDAATSIKRMTESERKTQSGKKEPYRNPKRKLHWIKDLGRPWLKLCWLMDVLSVHHPEEKKRSKEKKKKRFIFLSLTIKGK